MLRLAGREAWALGDTEDAMKWWGKALDCAAGLGARPELGRTLADAGRAIRSADADRTLQGRDARACLEEARSIFEDLDLAFDLAELPASA